MELEINKNCADKTGYFGNSDACVMVTPPIGEDYWLFRVKIHKDQAVLGFPKFSMVGIGFAIEEEDWNTNLPSSTSTGAIVSHIKCNKKYAAITNKMIGEAINLIKQAVK